jgi:hypothetical protein
MPSSPKGHCSRPGCPEFKPCPKHGGDQRASAKERGYGGKRWKGARTATLKRDPFCTCRGTLDGCDRHEDHECMRVSTVADHFPRERNELLAAGILDPDLPQFLRGMCASCHSRKTAHTRPGGWNDR